MYSFAVIHESRNLKQARLLPGCWLATQYACYSLMGCALMLSACVCSVKFRYFSVRPGRPDRFSMLPGGISYKHLNKWIYEQPFICIIVRNSVLSTPLNPALHFSCHVFCQSGDTFRQIGLSLLFRVTFSADFVTVSSIIWATAHNYICFIFNERKGPIQGLLQTKPLSFFVGICRLFQPPEHIQSGHEILRHLHPERVPCS